MSLFGPSDPERKVEKPSEEQLFLPPNVAIPECIATLEADDLALALATALGSEEGSRAVYRAIKRYGVDPRDETADIRDKIVSSLTLLLSREIKGSGREYEADPFSSIPQFTSLLGVTCYYVKLLAGNPSGKKLPSLNPLMTELCALIDEFVERLPLVLAEDADYPEFDIDLMHLTVQSLQTVAQVFTLPAFQSTPATRELGVSTVLRTMQAHQQGADYDLRIELMPVWSGIMRLASALGDLRLNEPLCAVIREIIAIDVRKDHALRAYKNDEGWDEESDELLFDTMFALKSCQEERMAVDIWKSALKRNSLGSQYWMLALGGLALADASDTAEYLVKLLNALASPVAESSKVRAGLRLLDRYLDYPGTDQVLSAVMDIESPVCVRPERLDPLRDILQGCVDGHEDTVEKIRRRFSEIESPEKRERLILHECRRHGVMTSARSLAALRQVVQSD